MKIEKLIKQMGRITDSLVTSFQSDFYEHDVSFLEKSGGKIPFVWLVRKNGTHIFETSDLTEVRRLIDVIDTLQENNTNFFLYRYDKKELCPTFPNEIHEWANNELKNVNN